MSAAPNPFGDGRAAERIVAAILYRLGRGDAPVEFAPQLSAAG
jgi:UDP-N-acetylglucosamine 2-epimerase (non-hydrolysing)